MSPKNYGQQVTAHLERLLHRHLGAYNGDQCMQILAVKLLDMDAKQLLNLDELSARWGTMGLPLNDAALLLLDRSITEMKIRRSLSTFHSHDAETLQSIDTITTQLQLVLASVMADSPSPYTPFNILQSNAA